MKLALALTVLTCAATACQREPEPTEAELRAKRDALKVETEQLRAQLDAKTQLFTHEAEALSGERGVVMAVPSSFLAETLQRAIADGLNDSALRLEDVKVGVSNDISVDLGLLRATLGDFVLDANLLEVRAQIWTRNPKVTVANGRFQLVVPVETSRGTGRAHLRFRWSGRGLANAICGDLDVARDVDGAAAPLGATLTGSARLAVEHGDFVVVPDVPRPRLRLVLEPSPAAWETLKSAVASQSDMCRTVLGKVDVVKVLRNLLSRGIVVNLPSDKLKPFRIPIAVTESLEVNDHDVTIVARPTHLSVGQPYTWFAASVEFHRSALSSR